MPTPYGSWIAIDASLQGAATAVKAACPGKKSVLKAIFLGTKTLPTTAVVAFTKVVGAVTPVTLLGAANEDIAALTAGVVKSLALSTAKQHLIFNATDMVEIAYTMTTAGSCAGVACTLFFEPLED